MAEVVSLASQMQVALSHVFPNTMSRESVPSITESKLNNHTCTVESLTWSQHSSIRSWTQPQTAMS